MAQILSGLPAAAPRITTSSQDEPPDEEAEVIAVKIGAAMLVWVPWPEEPTQWIQMRTCTIPEMESAYLYSRGKGKQLDLLDDRDMLTRFENLALMAFACRRCKAIETGVDETGGIKLSVNLNKPEEPLFTDPEHLRTSIRDEHTLKTLVGYYGQITAQYAPLSTYDRLAKEHEWERLLAVLKKKHGPIDWDAYTDEQVGEFMDYLVTHCPTVISPD